VSADHCSVAVIAALTRRLRAEYIVCWCAVYYAERNMGLLVARSLALGIVIAGVHQMPQRASAATAAGNSHVHFLF